MKPRADFGMKRLCIGLMITLFVGTLNTSNAQDIKPMVDLNAYTPQKKEKLKECNSFFVSYYNDDFRYCSAKITGWAKGKRIVENTPIRVEFFKSESSETHRGIYEGVYLTLDKLSFIDGRYAEEIKATESQDTAYWNYAGFDLFFIHQELSTKLNFSTFYGITTDAHRSMRYLVAFSDGKRTLIQKKLSDSSWLQKLVYPYFEEKMKPHDTIYRKLTNFDDKGIWHIVYKNGDNYEGFVDRETYPYDYYKFYKRFYWRHYGWMRQLNSFYDDVKNIKFYSGVYHFSNGDIYKGEIGINVLNGTEWYQDFSSTEVTFSDGEQAEKDWWGKATRGLKNEAKNKLIQESSSATDLRNRLRVYLEKEQARTIELEAKWKGVQQQFEKYKTTIRQKNGKYAAEIVNGELAVGMTKSEVISALCVHILTKILSNPKPKDNDATEYAISFMNDALNGKESFYKTLYKLESQQGDNTVWASKDLRFFNDELITIDQISDYALLKAGAAGNTGLRLIDSLYEYLTFAGGKLYGFSKRP